jgi:hypothetical protein
MGDQKFYLELLRASEGTLSSWSRLHLQVLAPTNPHQACVVGYGLFSLCVIHKGTLCPSSGDINRLMMMMMILSTLLHAVICKIVLNYCLYFKINVEVNDGSNNDVKIHPRLDIIFKRKKVKETNIPRSSLPFCDIQSVGLRQ